MAMSVVEPKGKGALLLDSHPSGCARTVSDDAATVVPGSLGRDAPTVLVIGCSAGYGQAITAAGLVGMRMSGLGLGLERAATARRTASAGWYRVRAMADLARGAGAEFGFLNGDCFAPETKQAVVAALKDRFGPVDYLVYSVAAPRRVDPAGATYQSVIKPLGEKTTTHSVDFEGGGRAVRRVEVDPATPEETEATVKVMGGEDWADWVAALADNDLLAPGATTVALSYIGSSLTAPIYRHGTIGAAKDHLEATARQLTDTALKPVGGTAVTSVNGAVVTQASTAIPGISLYVSLLRGVLGDGMQSPTTQAVRLWRHLTGAEAASVDAQGRIRLDDWEFADGVQPEVERHWQQAVGAGEISPDEAAWFYGQVHRLYGFGLPTVDYGQPVETDLPWPD
jgi:enoyl-[acyl-carrier protein] reductase / trans-2-enoyl-CoA reductase (NAD+)